MPDEPALAILPRRPALDSVLRVRLSGLPSHARVLVQGRQADTGGSVWSSSVGFIAREDGTIDLSRDAPDEGSYSGIDPMGLIWSMEPVDEPGTRKPGGPLAPSRLTVTAQIDGRPVCGAEVERLRIPDGLVRTQVHEHGMVGVLYQPGAQRAVPGVLLLGGSEGGLHEDDAALLAAHGYAVLALAYYGLPGLPATAQDIPLEYFEQALHLLQAAAHVRDGQLVVAGASMGGEAALLIGATFPLVGAVISIVGSGLIIQGISQDVRTGSFLDIMATPVPNWTRHGRPLPYLPNVVTPALRARVAAGDPIPLRMAFEPALARSELLVAATIPVERIKGPILLVSGEQDQGYGPAFHHVAADRLAAHHHPYPWEHVIHPGAGHLIAAPPYAPTTRTTSPGPGVTFEHGGTPAANAAARSATWQHVLRFLTLATAELRGGPDTRPAAVFRREVDVCAAEGPKLAARHDPGEALELWIAYYAGFIMTKRGLAAALHFGDPAFKELPGNFQQQPGPVLQELLDAAVAADAIRDGVSPLDLLGAIAKLCIPRWPVTWRGGLQNLEATTTMWRP